MKPNFEFRKSASLFAYRVEKECSIDRSIRHQSCPKIANLGDIKIFLKAFMFYQNSGELRHEAERNKSPSPASKVVLGPRDSFTLL